MPDVDPYPILSHSDMGMDMSSMNHDVSAMKGMDHSRMSMGKMAGSPPMGSGQAGYGSKLPQPHVPTEFGPH